MDENDLKQFEELVKFEHENLIQFPVRQIRPSLLGILRLAMKQEFDGEALRPIDRTILAFEAHCLCQYVYRLEKRLEKYEPRQRPDTQSEEWVNARQDDKEGNDWLFQVNNFFNKLNGI